MYYLLIESDFPYMGGKHTINYTLSPPQVGWQQKRRASVSVLFIIFTANNTKSSMCYHACCWHKGSSSLVAFSDLFRSVNQSCYLHIKGSEQERSSFAKLILVYKQHQQYHYWKYISFPVDASKLDLKTSSITKLYGLFLVLVLNILWICMWCLACASLNCPLSY